MNSFGYQKREYVNSGLANHQTTVYILTENFSFRDTFGGKIVISTNLNGFPLCNNLFESEVGELNTQTQHLRVERTVYAYDSGKCRPVTSITTFSFLSQKSGELIQAAIWNIWGKVFREDFLLILLDVEPKTLSRVVRMLSACPDALFVSFFPVKILFLFLDSEGNVLARVVETPF